MSNLTYIMPCFIIADLKISVSFYVDKLGFEVRYIGPLSYYKIRDGVAVCPVSPLVGALIGPDTDIE